MDIRFKLIKKYQCQQLKTGPGKFIGHRYTFVTVHGRNSSQNNPTLCNGSVLISTKYKTIYLVENFKRVTKTTYNSKDIYDVCDLRSVNANRLYYKEVDVTKFCDGDSWYIIKKNNVIELFTELLDAIPKTVKRNMQSILNKLVEVEENC